MRRRIMGVPTAAAMFLFPTSLWLSSPAGRERAPDIQLGDPLPGLTTAELADFDDGVDHFGEIEAPSDGLGPVFNGRSCAECHVHPVVGGSAFDKLVSSVTRFARVGVTFDPLAQLGGPLIQRNGLGDYPGQFGMCHIVGETVPPEANAVTLRITTPLFGAGLIDEIPDWEIILGSLVPHPDGISGRPNIVTDAVSGKLAVGRFGWKSQVAKLATFSGDAYLNEMGITSPSFPTENKPQGKDIPPGCDLKKDVEDSGADVVSFFNFMRLLAPPPRGQITPQVIQGGVSFIATGCASCHTPALTTGNSTVEALRYKPVRLFSDLLLHDIGTADGMEQGQAKGSEFRTAPLWGLSSRMLFMHDGRAATIPDAIAAHGGEATKVKNRYNGLNQSEKAAVLAFLRSL